MATRFGTGEVLSVTPDPYNPSKLEVKCSGYTVETDITRFNTLSDGKNHSFATIRTPHFPSPFERRWREDQARKSEQGGVNHG